MALIQELFQTTSIETRKDILRENITSAWKMVKRESSLTIIKLMTVQRKASKLYLWTEKGAFLHAKSLNTDVAWEVYDKLVDSYFEKSKAVPMTTDQKIQLLAQGNVELTEKVNAIDKDLQEFKADMPLLALECQKITRAKNQKVVPLMGGKDAPAYKNKSLMHKVYSDVDAQLRREFGVNTYKAIKRSQCDLAVEIIKKYELPRCLREEIEDENSQMCFAV